MYESYEEFREWRAADPFGTDYLHDAALGGKFFDTAAPAAYLPETVVTAKRVKPMEYDDALLRIANGQAGTPPAPGSEYFGGLDPSYRVETWAGENWNRNVGMGLPGGSMSREQVAALFQIPAMLSLGAPAARKAATTPAGSILGMSPLVLVLIAGAVLLVLRK